MSDLSVKPIRDLADLLWELLGLLSNDDADWFEFASRTAVWGRGVRDVYTIAAKKGVPFSEICKVVERGDCAVSDLIAVFSKKPSMQDDVDGSVVFRTVRAKDHLDRFADYVAALCPQNVSENQVEPETNQKEDWNSRALVILHSNREVIKSLGDLHKILKEQHGYTGKRPSLYAMKSVLIAAEALGIYEPKREIPRDMPGGYKSHGEIEAWDRE